MKTKEIVFISSILLILSCVNEDNEKIAVDVNYRESNLPIITINTYGEEIPDEPRIDAYMGIIDNGNVVNKTSLSRISLNCRFKSLLSPYDVFSKTHRNIPHFYKPLTVKPLTKIGFNFINGVNENKFKINKKL